MSGFSDAVTAALAARGVIVDDDGFHQLDPGFQGDRVVTQAQLDVVNANMGIKRAYSKVFVSWTENFSYTVQRMLSGESADMFSLRVVFYLRLHGFALDFFKIYSKSIEEGRRNAGSQRTLMKVVAVVEAMLGELLEDELLYAEYRRHVDAHIQQGAYEHRWNKKEKKPLTRFTSKLTGKTYHVDDLSRRIAAVLKVGEEPVALDLAGRVAKHLPYLVSSVRAFCGQ